MHFDHCEIFRLGRVNSLWIASLHPSCLSPLCSGFPLPMCPLTSTLTSQARAPQKPEASVIIFKVMRRLCNGEC